MFNRIPIKKVRLGLIALICLLAAALLPAMAIGRPKVAPAAQAGTVICTTGPTFNLETKTGHIQTPDGNSIFMWTYANADTGGNFQFTSPVLCVTQGVTVTVNLTNNLPVTTSIVFPGQTGVGATGDVSGLFTEEAAACVGVACTPGTASYTFVAEEPGTYLYESGTVPHQQVQMGLFGALIVRPAGFPNQAYADPSTKFDPTQEHLVLISDLDPGLHQAVERNETYDITTKHDHYWFVNGRSFPDSIADSNVPWLPSQPYGALVRIEATDPTDPTPPDPALIRYVNAGMENHPFHPHGNHMRVIGRDGRLLSLPFENFNTTIGSGQTYDLLFRWINVEQWTPGGNGDISVQITYPGLLNLVFKDGLSYFSGDPDLGVRADFPSDTTILNECGEFYFPWHSHALNEFQNFDEGFGGLATLVRVDPPGGCP